MDDRITYFFKILKDSKPVIEKLRKLKPIEPAILKVMRFVQHLESHFQTKLALNGVDDNEYQRKLRNTYHANQFYKERIEGRLKLITFMLEIVFCSLYKTTSRNPT